jgi:hypothetical protein
LREREPARIVTATATFTLRDPITNANLYPRVASSRFNIDTLQIFGTNGEKVRLFIGDADNSTAYAIQLPFYSSADTVGQNICKTYYVYLSQADTDTLRFCYQLNPTECNTELRNYQVFYNNAEQSITDRGAYAYSFDVKK